MSRLFLLIIGAKLRQLYYNASLYDNTIHRPKAAQEDIAFNQILAIQYIIKYIYGLASLEA